MKQTGLKPRTLYNYKLSVEPETTEETTEETPETVPRFKETTEETAEDTTCNDVEEHIPDALNTNRDVYNEDVKSKRVDDVIEDAERVDDVKEYNTSEAKTSDVLNNGCAKRVDDVIEDAERVDDVIEDAERVDDVIEDAERVDDVIEDAERVDDVKEYNTSEAKTSDVLNNGCAKRADDVIEATTSLTTMRCGAHDANLMTAIQDHDLIGVRTKVLRGEYWVWGQSPPPPEGFAPENHSP